MMNGEAVDEVLDALIVEDQSARLAELGDGM
jgi:protein subunit release factor A